MTKPLLYLLLAIGLSSCADNETDLVILFLNSQGQGIPDASVKLYLTEEDWSNDNVNQAETTDATGRATFENIERLSWYVRAVKGNCSSVGVTDQFTYTGPVKDVATVTIQVGC